METEIWKSHPDIPGIQVSTLGRVRTLDKMVSNGKGMRLVKGRILKPASNRGGYLTVSVKVNDKFISKTVHRFIAQTFLPNPDNLPEVNHKNCVRDDNRVSNLEWCTHSYNNQYREKHGVSQTEAVGHPLFAINLDTLKVSHFRSQHEASRVLGIDDGNINSVIKGKYKQTGGYWFKKDNGNGIEIGKDKLKSIADSIRFRQGIFALNLITSEVSRFRSQHEAGRVLGINIGNINSVIKGSRKQAGGFWFTNDDENADDAIKRKLHDIKKIYS